MSFLDKAGLTYTLQKLKPIIDKKANKSDVYTKEEFDSIIACDNSEKVSIHDILETTDIIILNSGNSISRK